MALEGLEGRRLNHRYRILRKLGEGGMGAVYLAADELEGEAPVAVKAIHGERIKSGAAVAYFKQEFEALARLSHPNLAQVFDFGVVESIEPPEADAAAAVPRYFFTCEYVDGVDLYKLAPKIGFDELYDLIVQTLRALSYIHSRGLVHYDVKPSNIMISGKPGAWRLKLLDFGLVGEKHAKLDAIKGTVRYIAPEVARGGPVDERADLYSLGVTLYQVTARQLPFEGESTVSVIKKHLDRAPESPRVHRSDLPPPLETLILRLIAKEPADRYPGADDAIRELGRLTDRPFDVETKETRAARLLSGRFVGREDAIARVLARAPGRDGGNEAAPPVPGPPAILLTGESGIGRTRLLRELKHALQLDGAAVLSGRAGTGAWAPFADVLRQAWRLADSLPGGGALITRYRAAAELAGVGPPAGVAAGAADGGAEERRALVLNGAAAFLLELAERRPFVLLLDDLGDGDRNALELGALLARGAAEGRAPPERRILLVAGARTDEGGVPGPLAELVQEGIAEELRLPRLRPADTATLVRSMLGRSDLPAGLADRVAAETGGNPFFIEEVVKALAEEGALEELTDSGRLPVPATVGEALARRVKRVGDAARRVLEALAIYARPARADAVAQILASRLEAVFPALRELERKGLVRSEDADDGAPLFAPASARLAELLAAEVPPERAVEVRRAAVKVLEADAAAGRALDAEALAEHARGAGDPERAVRYALVAAERARAVYANEKAIACYTLAIDTLEGEGKGGEADALLGRGEVSLLVGRSEAALHDFERFLVIEPAGPRGHLALGRARAALGDAPGAREAFERALERARSGGDRAAAAEALREQGNVEFSQGRYDPALERLEEAHRALQALGASGAAIARVLRDLATCLFEKGAYDRALECARESLAIEKSSGDKTGVARTLRSISQILYYRGEYDEAVAVARESIARSEEIGHPAGVAAALNQIGHILHAWGRIEEARASYEGALKIWRRIGDRSGIAAILNNLGCIAETQAEFETAASRYAESARHFEAIGYRGAVALAYGNLASATAMLGRLEEADGHATRALKLSQAVGNKRIEIEAKRARAEVRLWRGDLRGAREAAQEAVREARAIGNKACLGAALRTLGGAAREMGRPREARDSLEEAVELAQELGERSAAAAARLELARVALDEGRPGRAEAPLDTARSSAKGGEDRTSELGAQRVQGALFAALGEPGKALAAAEAAYARARELGVGVLYADTALELAAAREAAGRLDEAAALVDEARREAETRGQALAAVRARTARAGLPDGNLERTAELGAACRAAAEIGAVPVVAEAELARAVLLLEGGDPEGAAGRARDALKLAEDLGRIRTESRAHAVLGRAQAALGRSEAAARHFRRAIALVREVWFDLRAAHKEPFMGHPEVRALEKAARDLVVSVPASAAAGGSGTGPGTGTGAGTARGTGSGTDLGGENGGTHDSLTPALSHGYFVRRLDEEIARARRQGHALALLKLNADGFRAISEVHGAKAARALIRGLAEATMRSLREVDLCGRFFGDEFEVLLLDTDARGAGLTAERIQRTIEGARLTVNEQPAEMSVSIGIAAFPSDAKDRDGLLAKADEALLRARAGGAGRVFSFGDLAAAGSAPAPAPDAVEEMLLSREGRAILGIANRLLATDLDLDRVLDLACDMICEATKAERGFFMVREPDGRLRVRAGKGFERGTTGGEAYRVSHGIAERVARTGEAVLVAEATEDDRFRELRSVMELRLRSILCAPLKAPDSGEVIGVVYVDHNSIARKFVPADLHFLVAIADKIAPLVASGKRLAEQQQELEAAREKLQSSRGSGSGSSAIETKYSYDKIIGRSSAMQKVFQLLDRVVDTAHPVVIHGESGTGKELVARAIHYNGPRKLKPFVAENCAALTDTLLEAELFGHVKGAFTGADRDNKGLFELANGGTLFLDEIGDMSERMQKKLLRVLQEGEVRPVGGKRVLKVDVRVISASNKDLRKLVTEGQFREDLFYRLNVITVTLPALRERREDIPALVEHFLKKGTRPGTAQKRVDKDVYRLLMEYDWAGNVRELENEVIRMVAMSDDVVDESALSPKVREGPKGARPGGAGGAGGPSILESWRGRTLREIEETVAKEVILRTLEETNWHRSHAAEILGLPTSTLFNKMRKLGIA